ncbi:hypothetical protein [Kingella potus]|nr:hypothetical protein [Kingella potus]
MRRLGDTPCFIIRFSVVGAGVFFHHIRFRPSENGFRRPVACADD